jgi:hypothetical protein
LGPFSVCVSINSALKLKQALIGKITYEAKVFY